MIEFILYVKDQPASTDFYSVLLNRRPVLDVVGMTEFSLSHEVKLGLMPESGIRNIICPPLADPASASGIPRCELYLTFPDAEVRYKAAIDAGGVPVSPIKPRDWGHTVGYLADPDGHVIAIVSNA